jgi:hypothetical protein
MESFAASSGKTMVLNKYADCTKEEYEELMNGTKVSNTAKDLKVDSSVPDKAESVQLETEKVTIEVRTLSFKDYVFISLSFMYLLFDFID